MSDVNVHPQHHASNHPISIKKMNPLVDCNGECCYNMNSFTKSPTMPVIMASACVKHAHNSVNSNSNPNLSNSSAISSCCRCCDGASSSHSSVSCISCSYFAGHTLPITSAIHPIISRSQHDIFKFDDEKLRKRLYRVGLNLFNKKEEVSQ